jgi:TolB-like protein
MEHVKPSRRVLTLAGLLLLLGVAPGAAQAQVRVAVLPLQVNALEQHDYLQKGLADMLTSRIGRVEGVSVLRVDDPKKATRKQDQARSTAQDLGAEYVVFGSFTAFGGGASLDLICSSVADGTTKRGFVQAGNMGEIIPQLDGVAEKIARFAAAGAAAAPAVAAAPPSAKAGGGAEAERIRELESRIEALERVVFSQPKEPLEESDVRGTD